MSEDSGAQSIRQARFVEFLSGQGWIGRAILETDWSKTPIGPISGWPVSLQSTLRMVLTTKQSANFFWGPDLQQFFNEAYAPALTGMPPDPVGAPFKQYWGEVFEGVRPYYERAMAGEGTWEEDLPLALTRNGVTESTFWTFSYSPLYDDDGAIAGFLNIVNETTRGVTTRQALEQARADLAAERETLARMFEQSPSFMAMLRGPDHVLEMTNAHYLRLIGHRDVIGRTVADALPDATEQGYVELLDSVYRSGEAYTALGARYAVQAEPGGPVDERHVDFVFQPVRDGHGDVSGILVNGFDVTERASAVTALRDNEERMRMILEGARDYAIMTVDGDHRITTWSRGAEDVLGRGAAETIGQPFEILFTADDRLAGLPARALEDALRDGVQTDLRWHRRPDGGRVFMDSTVRPLPKGADGRERGFLKIARNATAETRAKMRQEAVLQLSDRLRDLSDPTAIALVASDLVGKTLGITLAGYGLIDSLTGVLTVEGEWRAEGRPTGEMVNLGDTPAFVEQLKKGEWTIVADAAIDSPAGDEDAPRAFDVRAFVAMPIIEQGRLVAALYAGHATPHVWTPDDLSLIRDIGERTRAGTQRVRAEAEQDLFNRELSHRLKNSFAMVQAIASQTLRSVTEREPVKAFERRLQALSSAHDILLQDNWTGATVRAIVLDAPEKLGLGDRVVAHGPHTVLGPRAALTLTLLLHELLTNALKHGSLSVDDGRVEVVWRIEGTHPDIQFHLGWTEKGGPPAIKPARQGFGSRLIRLGLAGSGNVEMDYRADGFSAHMHAPLAQLQHAG